MTNVKICGIQPGDHLDFTGFMEVTHIGIVFVPTSRRYVTPQDARGIVEKTHASCTTIGVFVNESESAILDSLETSGVQGAQLHGQETPDFCNRLRERGYIVWKAISVAPTDGAECLLNELRRFSGSVDAVLFDAAPPKNAKPGLTGGYGLSFDWQVLSKLNLADQKDVPPVWIAGGLNARNVSALLKVFDPFGIDVSSGVEFDGRKSDEQIVSFIKEVRQHAS